MPRITPYQMHSYANMSYRPSGKAEAAPQEAAAPAEPAGRAEASFAPRPATGTNALGPADPYLYLAYDPAAMAVRGRIQYALGDAAPQNLPGTEKLPGARDAEPCTTCNERAYMDGSNDSSVSFQTPTHIDPGQSASAVRSHEREHVFREQALAKQNGREVISQSVSIHTAVCPECGRPYVSGGTTCTVTKEEARPKPPEPSAQNQPKAT